VTDEPVARTTDPDGRDVVFDERVYGHLLDRRRRHLLDQLAVIVEAVARPDHHEDDPIAGRERFYRYNPITERWLRVVVDFGEEPGFVVTALAQRTDPRPKS
jgi:hypothetical protein